MAIPLPKYKQQVRVSGEGTAQTMSPNLTIQAAGASSEVLGKAIQDIGGVASKFFQEKAKAQDRGYLADVERETLQTNQRILTRSQDALLGRGEFEGQAPMPYKDIYEKIVKKELDSLRDYSKKIDFNYNDSRLRADNGVTNFEDKINTEQIIAINEREIQESNLSRFELLEDQESFLENSRDELFILQQQPDILLSADTKRAFELEEIIQAGSATEEEKEEFSRLVSENQEEIESVGAEYKARQQRILELNETISGLEKGIETGYDELRVTTRVGTVEERRSINARNRFSSTLDNLVEANILQDITNLEFKDSLTFLQQQVEDNEYLTASQKFNLSQDIELRSRGASKAYMDQRNNLEVELIRLSQQTEIDKGTFDILRTQYEPELGEDGFNLLIMSYFRENFAPEKFSPTDLDIAFRDFAQTGNYQGLVEGLINAYKDPEGRLNLQGGVYGEYLREVAYIMWQQQVKDSGGSLADYNVAAANLGIPTATTEAEMVDLTNTYQFQIFNSFLEMRDADSLLTGESQSKYYNTTNVALQKIINFSRMNPDLDPNTIEGRQAISDLTNDVNFSIARQLVSNANPSGSKPQPKPEPELKSGMPKLPRTGVRDYWNSLEVGKEYLDFAGKVRVKGSESDFWYSDQIVEK